MTMEGVSDLDKRGVYSSEMDQWESILAKGTTR